MSTINKREMLSRTVLSLAGANLLPMAESIAAPPAGPLNDTRLGIVIDPNAAKSVGGAGVAFSRALDQLNTSGGEWPAVVFGAGEFDLGAANYQLLKRSASISGLSIDATRLFGTGRPVLDARNYAGRTADLSLFCGKPGEEQRGVRNSETDGLLLEWTGGHGEVRNVQVNNFNGYGVRINCVWDAHFENIIIVGCGNENTYAFEVRAAGDTSNHTVFSRVQVEDSFGKAMSFAADNINLIVDGIHSEGTVGNGRDYTHILLGGFCSYRNARIANDGGGVKVRLGGGRNSYRDMWFQEGTQVDYIWGSEGPQFRSLIDNCMFDVLRVPASNKGEVTVRDSFIRHLIVQSQKVETVRLHSCHVGSIEVTGNPQSVLIGR